jgi:hypothetical protein
MSKHCANCGASLEATARFCHRCGAERGGSTGPAPAAAAVPAATSNQVLPWAVAGIALLCLLAFIVGQNWRRGQPAPSAVTGAPVGASAGGPAVDISQMSPQERADRLFFRVMTYVSEGKTDSVQFFAPMAIQSFQAMAPLDAHQRYDLGLIGVVSGDGVMARAQADSILAEQPDHLLGLILGMRSAGLQLASDARAEYARRFLAALDRERAKPLPEYVDHAPDIEAAVREADGRAATGGSAIPPV